MFVRFAHGRVAVELSEKTDRFRRQCLRTNAQS